MIRTHWKSISLAGLGVVLGLLLSRLPNTPAQGNGDGKAVGPKPASAATKTANAALLKKLPFDNTQDFKDAQRGFIAALPNGGVVKNAKGEVIYDGKAFALPLDAKAPDSVNPSLWRQSQLNGIAGLFKVVDGIYQIRGLDLANITFIEGDKGVIIVDPLTTAEPAKIALELYRKHRGDKPVTAVMYTHSHADHFGGAGGITSKADVNASKTRVIAPEHFTEEAVSENVIAGNVMVRRASYMYGNLLGIGPMFSLGSGLGTSASGGELTLILPSDIITRTGQKLTVDGVEFEFLMAPSSEAPSEMHFYMPKYKALCTAENACHTMHNFYTLRGAKTRDIKKWVGYLNETLDMWGDRAEVLFAPHHWPTWGNAEIVDHIEKYRDTFQYIHDQVLRLANQGHVLAEMGDLIEMPESLAQNWSSRGYYGTVSHNARAVYNYYLGYFSGNPSELNPLPPIEAATRYVEFMGGADAVLAKAKAYMDKGEYRWVAQVVNHVVIADPKNQKARDFLADALEQMGYQAESGPWRNFYITGAQELRDGIKKGPVPTISPDFIAGMPTDLFFDYLGVRLNGPRAAGKNITINFSFTDTKEQYAVTVKNGVLNHRKRLGAKPHTSVTLTRLALNDVLAGKAKMTKLITDGVIKIDGEAAKLQEMLALMDSFEFWFEIVTINPAPKK